MPVHCQLLMGCPDETWHQVKHCDFLDVAVPLIFRSYRASGDFRWWANLIGAARKQANDIDHSVHATRPKMVITTPSKMAPKSRVGSRSRIMSDKCRNYWTRQRRSRGRVGGGLGWGVEKKVQEIWFSSTGDAGSCGMRRGWQRKFLSYFTHFFLVGHCRWPLVRMSDFWVQNCVLDDLKRIFWKFPLKKIIKKFKKKYLN